MVKRAEEQEARGRIALYEMIRKRTEEIKGTEGS